ncbi:hypothetical protein VNO78_22430 [Psophocarpus tetragonolobus]|uniref:Uncharacterized protein n=1 Tax=Psophocarpus tetragonolobus TaxID=3891 RepID=A0AAN9XBF3_PSOTE
MREGLGARGEQGRWWHAWRAAAGEDKGDDGFRYKYLGFEVGIAKVGVQKQKNLDRGRGDHYRTNLAHFLPSLAKDDGKLVIKRKVPEIGNKCYLTQRSFM